MITRFHEKGFAFLASLRLTLVVLILLISCLFVGMFWDQTLTLDEHLATMDSASASYATFRFFELNDIFHSWWFSLVVLALALNLIACSVERLPKIWVDIHNPPWPPTDRDFKTATHKSRFVVQAKEAALKAIRESFPNILFEQHDQDGTSYFYGERHKYGRTGVYVIHISLLMIMFGSIAATNLGVDGMLVIPETQNTRIARIKGPGGVPYQYDLGFDVRCVDFRLKTFVDGSPMEFESDLAIYDPPRSETPVAQKTIRVNDPLQYRGYTFYQSSYQAMPGEESVHIAVAAHGKTQARHHIPLGTTLTTADGTKVIPLEVFREYAGLGEALKVQVIEPNEKPMSFLVFRQYPDFDPLVRRGGWDVFYYGSDQKFATGVSVGKVPGVTLVFVGFMVMFVGLYMAFIMNHRRYFARVRPNDDGTWEVFVGGQARRHLYSFQDEYKAVEAKIKRHEKYDG
jgi:cytochrome c biogenesis protein